MTACILKLNRFELAYRRGRKDQAIGLSVRAAPSEYRPKEREAEFWNWVSGWHDASVRKRFEEMRTTV